MHGVGTEANSCGLKVPGHGPGEVRSTGKKLVPSVNKSGWEIHRCSEAELSEKRGGIGRKIKKAVVKGERDRLPGCLGPSSLDRVLIHGDRGISLVKQNLQMFAENLGRGDGFIVRICIGVHVPRDAMVHEDRDGAWSLSPGVRGQKPGELNRKKAIESELHVQVDFRVPLVRLPTQPIKHPNGTIRLRLGPAPRPARYQAIDNLQVSQFLLFPGVLFDELQRSGT